MRPSRMQMGGQYACDPCPVCGAAVEVIEGRAITITSNPGDLIVIPDPGCPRERDPAADCTCTVVPNLVPDPLEDQVHVVGYEYTVLPCGHHPASVTIRAVS
jgi:hypothetical protein